MRNYPQRVAPDMHQPHMISLSIDKAQVERDQWIHDFRNALGNTTIAASAVRGVLEQQRYEQVEKMMQQVEEGCARCLRLLATMPR